MKTTILSMCGLLLVAPLAAETKGDDPGTKNEALEILQKVDAATKAVTSVRYKVSVEATGIAANFTSNAKGQGFMTGWNGSGPEKFYGRIETSASGEDEPTTIEGGGDGESYFLIDHGTKKAYEDMDPLVMGGSGQALQGLGMVEFVHPAPFDDELGADVAEIQGSEDIHGEECWKIYVEYSGGRGRSTWFVSKNDYLPRGRIRHLSNPDRGDGELIVKLADLEVEPKIDARMFKLDLPDGYEQIDDFAP